MLTAARVFALAIAVGLGGATGQLQAVAAAFLALCVLALVMSIPIPPGGWQAVSPVAEGALAALLLTSAGTADNPLLAYFLVPPLAAGLQCGIWGVVATTATQSGAVLSALLATAHGNDLRSVLEDAAPWILVGLGLGLLGAWVRASSETSVDEQEHYEFAHRLLAQLNAVAQDLPYGLDGPSLAQRTLSYAVAPLEISRAMLLVRDHGDSWRELASQGQRFPEPPHQDSLVDQCWRTARSVQSHTRDESADAPLHRTVLPVRVAVRLVGVVVLDTSSPLTSKATNSLQARIDEQSLSLESAMLFEQVRSMATVEERHRLAREIHDGIAQEIASLGYLVDEIAVTTQADGHDSVQALRAELTRIVNELRLSIFDLRVDVNQYGGLGQALSDYARDVGTRTGMTVHMALAQTPHRLAVDVETELLRIAQEAITNARKHARANNLWVTLNTNGSVAVLRIEDDGVGSARTRDDHYGIRIMHERADRIGAELVITNRSRGGTSVVVALQPSNTTTSGAHRVDFSLTR